MQLDDLKEEWTAHGAVLERSLRINERLLREVMERKIRFALAPYVLGRAFEVAVGLVVAVPLGSVLAAHIDDARYVLVAGVLAVFVIAITAMSAYLLVNAVKLDYGGPVTGIQREIERIKMVEYRAFKWALLGGIVIWLPAILVLFEAVFGVDALARADPLYVGANLVFGVVVLAFGLALSKKYVERPDLRPWARRLVDSVSGRQLQSVTKFLAELSSFEREEPS